VEELRSRDCLEDLCIGGRIRLRWSWLWYCWRVYAD